MTRCNYSCKCGKAEAEQFFCSVLPLFLAVVLHRNVQNAAKIGLEFLLIVV